MKKIAIVLLFICALVVSIVAQKKMKPWNEWNEKEVQKMLNDSPWGQTQTETNTSEMFYSPTTQGGGGARAGATGGSNRSTEGALNQATDINFRIRFLTAKPIRQAIARQNTIQNPQMAEQLRAFAEQKTDQFIVVAVVYDSRDQRFTGKALQAFNSAVIGTLKNNTYLETKDGKRLFLQQYVAPSNDGMGVKFVFPRAVDGEPFVSANGGYLRFYSEVSKDIKLNMRFKLSEMMYEGVLEY